MGAEKGMIFGSMPCGSWDHLKPWRDWPDLVIAADGGLALARQAGFSPRVYIGDGDSGGRGEGQMECIFLKPEKDETDLEAAYGWARDHGLKELIFTGCTGGRQDHFLAALGLLETAAEEGLRAVMLDQRNRIEFLPPGRYSIPKRNFTYFSLLPVEKRLEGLSIRGAKYPLQNRTVLRGGSLTVSNEWAGAAAEIEFAKGACFLVQSRDKASNQVIK